MSSFVVSGFKNPKTSQGGAIYRSRHNILKSNLLIQPSHKNLTATKNKLEVFLKGPKIISEIAGGISLTRTYQDSLRSAEIKDIVAGEMLHHYNEKEKSYDKQLLAFDDIKKRFDEADNFFNQHFIEEKIATEDVLNDSVLLKNKKSAASGQANKKLIMACYGLGDTIQEWKRRLYSNNRDFFENNQDVDILLTSVQNMPNNMGYSHTIQEPLKQEFYKIIEDFLVKDSRSIIPSHEFLKHRLADTLKCVGKQGYNKIVAVGNSRGSFAILDFLEDYEKKGGAAAFHNAHIKGAILTAPIVNAQNAMLCTLPYFVSDRVYDILDDSLFSMEQQKIRSTPVTVLSGTRDEICPSEVDHDKPLVNYYGNDILEHSFQKYLNQLPYDNNKEIFETLGISNQERNVSIDGVIEKLKKSENISLTDNVILGYKNFLKNVSAFHKDILSPNAYLKSVMTENIPHLDWKTLDNAHHTLFVPSKYFTKYFSDK